MRQIVLDTETTGLDPTDGHRIIEIGCVEMIDRRCTGKVLHRYINPEREIDDGAAEVHGITTEQLADKPLFAAIAAEFIDFVRGAELVIHNAPFDVRFLNAELRRLSPSLGLVEDHCAVLDTLVMARQKHPGQRASLDALCKRYGVDNSGRELHGALLDARLLAEMYLLMTGGQVGLSLDGESSAEGTFVETIRRLDSNRAPLKVTQATAQELEVHNEKLTKIAQTSESGALWQVLEKGTKH
ncbi:MAG: DNA polymerase III subunit epsilon [Gammaproteobacteria bacterium]|jgi:DNA polymerase-3 subunit epsilon|nr:DNA polymerase III subunit epsilon [Gammaproteobacteria bacterium]MBQ0773923.1 DNA polymerase III subunit epsilon [Gammaproteobacteria bacterium]